MVITIPKILVMVHGCPWYVTPFTQSSPLAVNHFSEKAADPVQALGSSRRGTQEGSDHSTDLDTNRIPRIQTAEKAEGRTAERSEEIAIRPTRNPCSEWIISMVHNGVMLVDREFLATIVMRETNTAIIFLSHHRQLVFLPAFSGSL